MIELLSLHVPDARRCKLASPFRRFPGSESSEAIQVAERMLWVLGLSYECPAVMDLFRAQAQSGPDLRFAAIVLWDHGLAIESSSDRATLAGVEVQLIKTSEDAWDIMQVIAAHCGVGMPQFDFRPV